MRERGIAAAAQRLPALRCSAVETRRDLDAEGVVAIEVKADAAPDAEASKHLRWLRDELGDRFVTGFVLHTGPRLFQMDDRITAVPICTLWG